VSSGNSQLNSMPGPLNWFCIAASWSGSAMSPPTQYGWPPVGMLSSGVPTRMSWFQKVEPGSRLASTAVT
jgi:hypothetical protein